VTRYVAVCGSSIGTEEELARAEEVGRLLAEARAIVLCGGLGGVMDAAAGGAKAAGGTSVGLLPGEDREGASDHLTVALPTGMGETRNALIIRAADAVIAIGGEWGTLSEIAFAMRTGKRVVGLGTWELSKSGRSADGILSATTPEEAVRLALEP
jgi:uncharacterized protein (TIGR00725 family)